MRRLPLWTTVFFGCAWLLAFSEVRAQEQQAAPDSLFSPDQLEQLVAPIALYPDSLVAQILMASTYPLEIVEADRWRERNPDLEGADLEQALGDQRWDPSVKALTNFPDLLKRMSDNLDWTQDLGDAVLAQEGEVMDAVQHMRHIAYDEGNLKTTPEQKVIVQEKVIVVEPATEVVYVPAYSPTVVYGSVWAPATYYYPWYSYPSSYWYPPGYVASNIISFGVGMAVGAAIWGNWNWGHCNWRGRGVTINNNFNFSRNINTRNFKVNKGGGRYSNWQHNVNHRGGVRYRDSSTRQRYAKAEGGRGARIDRDSARGFDRSGKRDLARVDSRDLKRDTRDRQRPESRDVKRPESRDVKRPESRDVKRPESRDVKRPESRDVQRPQKRDTTRTQDRVATREAPRAQTRDTGSRGGSRSGAFNVGSGGFDRAASSRGASSRSVSRSSGSHSGGSLKGGGGGSRGGGAARSGGALRR